jgi:hypothetical protein
VLYQLSYLAAGGEDIAAGPAPGGERGGTVVKAS